VAELCSVNTKIAKIQQEEYEKVVPNGYLNFEPGFEPGSELGSKPGFEPGFEPIFASKSS